MHSTHGIHKRTATCAHAMTPSICDPARDLLRNIVATVNLDVKLDLKTIALHARNAEYNPKVRPYASVLGMPKHWP